MSTTLGQPSLPPSSQFLPNGSIYSPSTLKALANHASNKTSPNLAASAGHSANAAHLNQQAHLQEYLQQRGRTEEEKEIMKATSARIATQLAADQNAVLHPNIEAPFVDYQDVVARLLPYHVFHQPRDDLLSVKQSWKGKEKATASPEDELVEEISETRFALECHKRRRALEKRFKAIRIREGKRSAPSDQGLYLAQVIVESDRVELGSVSAELRQAKTELEKITRAKKAAENAAKAQYQAQAAAAATTSASPTTAQYYQGYSYAYPNGYTSSFRAAPTAYSATPSASAVSAVPSAASSRSTSAGPTPVNHSAYTPSSGAIPVQLPISLLPSLNNLDITPVPPPAPGQPPAAAVLQGSNGTMVNLLFDVGQLQSHQMTGLAMILNSLMATGINAHSSTPVDPTTAMRGAASVVSAQQSPQVQPYGSTVGYTPPTVMSAGNGFVGVRASSGGAGQVEKKA